MIGEGLLYDPPQPETVTSSDVTHTIAKADRRIKVRLLDIEGGIIAELREGVEILHRDRGIVRNAASLRLRRQVAR